ncbi:response regulator transcription factor [Streptomyces sp. PSAA01]|uniref:response regulator transcription factor n=1 Tax=Streptomyces sp. PSAA01 TaxID=2912762 RepID=UPI0027E29768|nr:response regulator transcription factor [Streptomyces sp. PSAA01]
MNRSYGVASNEVCTPGVRTRKAGGITDLTARELRILRLVTRGMSNRGIARTLDISEKTVRNHLSSIFPKVGAADRTQAALFAVRVGIDGRRTALTPVVEPIGRGAGAGTRGAERPLTAREVEILGLLTRGMSNRGIARTLDISEKTVRNHLSSIFPKVGAADRTQAAVYALCAGLVS